MIVDVLTYYRFIFLLLFPHSSECEPVCSPPYSCISTRECAERHAYGGTEEVLFQCARKTKVCCPPITANTIVNPTLPTKEETDDERFHQKQSNHKKFQQGDLNEENLDFTTHKNAHLLPQNNECGSYIGDKITDGAVAGLVEFPWMALVGYKEGIYSNKDTFICGASLISDRYVLTAAHCLSHENKTIEFVRLGEYNISSEIDCARPTCDVNTENCKKTKRLCLPPPQDIPIEEIFRHEDYNGTTFKNDIALLRLSRAPSQPNNYTTISPICLPLNPKKVNLTGSAKYGLTYEIAGWGKTKWDSTFGSPVLRKSTNDDRIKRYPVESPDCKVCHDEKKKFCPITENQICIQGYQGLDVCKGDSGGPLMVTHTNKYVAGIVSFKSTEVCGQSDVNIPSIFTNVVPYVPWILDRMRE